MSEITDDTLEVLMFVRERTGISLAEGMKALGLKRDGKLIAGVVFDGANGHNCWMHVAADQGGRWLNRKFLRACFEYAFVTLGLSRVSGYVSDSNLQAKRFDEHLGFKEESRLKGAAHDGGDVILYVMWRKDCRHVDTIQI